MPLPFHLCFCKHCPSTVIIDSGIFYRLSACFMFDLCDQSFTACLHDFLDQHISLLSMPNLICDQILCATPTMFNLLCFRLQGLNVYSIFLHDTLVMSRDAVNRIVERMHTPINR